MRQAPAAPKLEDIKKRSATNVITQIRQYELITPLFGGGVEPGYADPITVIRGTEIRGHLRFWWRGTRGGEFDGSLARMKEAEDLLWGAASSEGRPQQSQVQIAVEVSPNDRGNPLPAYVVGGQPVPASSLKSPYGYVAFPLRGKEDAELLEDIKFTLTISFPQISEPDIAAALWAWETFGGIGARTRRGCGALRLIKVNSVPTEKLPAVVADIKQRISDQLIQHVSDGTWPEGVPHLSCIHEPTITRVERSTDKADKSSIRVWRTLIRALRQFRQARPGSETSPGRSRWPEPDAIRREAGTHAESDEKSHAPSPTMPTKFPRAEFGLPIEFKFKGEDVRIGDPPKATLKGGFYERVGNKDKYRERLASRLILRPLACGNDVRDDAAVGLAIILDAPKTPPEGLTLHIQGIGVKVAHAELDPSDIGNIAPLNSEPDVLKAFLNTLPQGE